MKIDSETRRAIVDAVRAAVVQRVEQDGEVWLNGRDLCKKFGMFSPDWLKRNGWRLPRRRVEYVGDDGETHATQWGYAMREIQTMVEAGRI